MRSLTNRRAISTMFVSLSVRLVQAALWSYGGF